MFQRSNAAQAPQRENEAAPQPSAPVDGRSIGDAVGVLALTGAFGSALGAIGMVGAMYWSGGGAKAGGPDAIDMSVRIGAAPAQMVEAFETGAALAMGDYGLGPTTAGASGPQAQTGLAQAVSVEAALALPGVSAAHADLPLGSTALITRLDGAASAHVTIAARPPAAFAPALQLSAAASQALDLAPMAVAGVLIEPQTDAPLFAEAAPIDLSEIATGSVPAPRLPEAPSLGAAFDGDAPPAAGLVARLVDFTAPDAPAVENAVPPKLAASGVADLGADIARRGAWRVTLTPFLVDER